MVLELVNTLVGRFAYKERIESARCQRLPRPPFRWCEHTVSSTLWHWLLATSTANTDTIDDIALLGLVTKTASLIRARRARSTMDDIQLSELYFALSANVQRVYSRGIDLSKDAHIKVHVHNIHSTYVRRASSKVLFRFRFRRNVEFILPPSIGHGEGSGGHPTASSFAIPRRT